MPRFLRTPVVLISGMADDLCFPEPDGAAFDAVFAKPVSAEELTDTMTRLLDGRTTSSCDRGTEMMADVCRLTGTCSRAAVPPRFLVVDDSPRAGRLLRASSCRATPRP